MTLAQSPLACLRERLRGTAPSHGRETWRLGGGIAAEVAPGFETLLEAEPVPAAVLVGLVERNGATSVLLTVRASRLRNHGGQISFPGGRVEPEDESLAAAALREAQEEIGLDPGAAEILGFLPDHLVLTGYRVTPVVARLPHDALWTLDAAEVQQVFELPWDVLDDDALVGTYQRQFAELLLPMREVHFAGHRIWGLTASILVMLRDLARGTST